MNLIKYLLTFILIASCGQDNLEKRKRDLGYSTINQERRAKSCDCTFEHNPVCGNDGKSYNNPCLASCHEAGGYTLGACECNINSGYLCGQPPMPECPEGMSCPQVMPSAKTYTDECELLRDNARYIHIGVCR